MVFQSYALWPHMTVRKNICYPLRARKIKEGLRNGWVEETAKMVDCSALLDRYPAQLSGGQQQRVALARGLVARPGLVLFDEPLSNLDARLRDHVRAELHEVHGRLGFTAVFVTHDQSEALALGDRLAIMRNGAVEQYDTPEQVFEHPVSEYVAAFIGMDNRLVCEYLDGRWTVAGEPIEGDALPQGGNHPPLALRLRADDLRVALPDSATPAGSSSLLASVIDTEYGGRHLDIVLDANGTRLFARIPSGESGSWERSLGPGDAVRTSFHGRDAHFFDEHSGIRSDATVERSVEARTNAVLS
jgi:iron(III) transport system ATP-binding protein